MDRIDKQGPQRMRHGVEDRESSRQRFHFGENAKLKGDAHAAPVRMRAQRRQMPGRPPGVGIGRNAQHVLRTKLGANIDHGLVRVEIVPRLDPDDFDIQQFKARVRQRAPGVPRQLRTPFLRLDPKPRRIEAASGCCLNRFKWPAFGDNPGRERYAVHIELPPSTRNSPPVVKADSSEARYRAMAAISSGRPIRPIGCVETQPA